MTSFKPAILALADGTLIRGRALGYEGTAMGEVVFNTAMTGYQEILTDPSYCGQMVVMTCPHIGTYGVNQDDMESRKPWAQGFIVKEATPHPSNWRAVQSLHEYLVEQKVVGIQGIDTRFVTRHLREYGSQNGMISHQVSDPEALLAQVRLLPSIEGRDLVSEVTCDQPYVWKEGMGNWPIQLPPSPRSESEGPLRVVVMDFGVKRNILRLLVAAGCEVTVVPARTTAEAIKSMNPDGVMLSNGPGDPQGVRYAVPEIRQLIGWRPMLAICLGHQILGMTLGLPTYKLKFGHHGANHPVMDLRTRKVEITSQNHNFAIGKPEGTPAGAPEGAIVEPGKSAPIPTPFGEFDITHCSLNDGCLEGLVGRDVPVLSFQYHPEASPGPHDSSYLFAQFTALMESRHA